MMINDANIKAENIVMQLPNFIAYRDGNKIECLMKTMSNEIVRFVPYRNDEMGVLYTTLLGSSIAEGRMSLLGVVKKTESTNLGVVDKNTGIIIPFRKREELL